MKQIKVNIFSVLFFLVTTGLALAVPAANPEQVFFEANQAYQKADYDGALALYRQILDEGFVSGAVYFNMGNAYFRKQEYGRALLYYERAKKWIPKDEDLFANREFVHRLLPKMEGESQAPWYQRVLVETRDALTPERWFILGGSLYVVFFGLLAVSFFIPSRREMLRIYLIYHGIFMMIIASFGVASLMDEANNQSAIVTAKQAAVRYSPTYSGSVAFEVPEGMRARILRRNDDWFYARFARGKAGWVEGREVEII